MMDRALESDRNTRGMESNWRTRVEEEEKKKKRMPFRDYFHQVDRVASAWGDQ